MTDRPEYGAPQEPEQPAWKDRFDEILREENLSKTDAKQVRESLEKSGNVWTDRLMTLVAMTLMLIVGAAIATPFLVVIVWGWRFIFG